LFDGRTATERAFQVSELGGAPQRDVEGGLQLAGVVSIENDESEDTSLGRLMQIARVLGIEKCDDRTRCLMNDRGDLLERVPSRPNPRSATSAPVLRLSLRHPRYRGRATISWPSPSTIAEIRSSRSSRSLAMSTCKRCSGSTMSSPRAFRDPDARGIHVAQRVIQHLLTGGLTKRTPTFERSS